MSSNLEIQFTWKTTSPLSVHTGVARAGGVDRVVRTHDGSPGGRPELRGEAIKAAIREAAERILRWRGRNAKPEEKDRSIPDGENEGALARLFAPQWAGTQSAARYYFHRSVAPPGRDSPKFQATSTSIDPQSGAARDLTLRSVELWSPGIEFQIEIEAFNWSASEMDRRDLYLLLAAITAVDSIGGYWGVGCGELQLIGLKTTTSGPDQPPPFNLTEPLHEDLAFWLA